MPENGDFLAVFKTIFPFCMSFHEHTKNTLILKALDPSLSLSGDADKLLVTLLNDFVTDVTEGAARIAKSNGVGVVTQEDVNAYLRTSWDISVEGYRKGDTPK
ncbi:hypothetical protein WA556_001408 [Blastocystis sp. ATCC 50177/Nand II]